MNIAIHTITFILLVLANGGRHDWAYNAFALVLWLHAIPITIELVKRRANIHGRGPLFWIVAIIIPWAAFIGLFAYALFNPSHQTIYNNLFSPLIPLTHNLDLPTTPNPARSLLFSQFLAGLLLMTLSLLITPITRKQIRISLNVVFIFGTVLAGVGSLMKLTNTKLFLWFIEFREPVAFATFFYKNHWAYFALLCAGIGMALYQHTFKRERQSGHLPEKSIAYALCTLLILISIPLAQARGASLAAIPLALTFLYTILKPLLQKRHKIMALSAFLLCAGITFGSFYKIVAPQFERAVSRSEKQLQDYKLKELGSVKRIALYRDTWTMIQQKPIWGWGIGSFIHIHPIYADQVFYKEGAAYPVAYEFCHSEYLESVAEMGLAGSALLLLPFGFLFLGLTKKANWKNPFGFGLVLASALVLATAAIDFTLSSPAIAMGVLFCASLGLRYSLLSSRMRVPKSTASAQT
jgi:O-antigen ligase